MKFCDQKSICRRDEIDRRTDMHTFDKTSVSTNLLMFGIKMKNKN